METTQITLESFRSVNSAAVDAELDRLADEKAKWLDRLAKHYFPKDLVELVEQYQNPEARVGVLGWSQKRVEIKKRLKELGYEIREVPSQHLTQFCRKIDGKVEVLAEFKIEFKGQQPRPPV